MMETYEQIKEALESRSRALETSIQSFRADMEHSIKQVKNNEILNAINKINTRLSAIEARLPEPEDAE